MEENGGHPHSPGRETPAPLILLKRIQIESSREGGVLTATGRETPAPLCMGRELGTPPTPRQGDPCTPLKRERVGDTPTATGRETLALLVLLKGHK